MAVIEQIQWPETIKVLRYEPDQNPEAFLDSGAVVVIVHNEGASALTAGFLFLYTRYPDFVAMRLRTHRVTAYRTPGEDGILRVPIDDLAKLETALRTVA